MRPELFESLKRIGWVTLVFTFLFLLVSALERKEESTVAGVEIEIEPLPGGYRLLTPGDVHQLLQRSFGFDLERQPLSRVDLRRVERVLEYDPFVRDAEVHLDALNYLHLDIVQRRPVVRILDEMGLNYYLDEEGQKMPLSPHFTARVLVATGQIPPYTPEFLQKEKHLLKDLFRLVEFIRQDEFLSALIEQVDVRRGECTLIPKVGDQKILLGRPENLEDKFRRLKIFYEQGIPYEGWQKYKTINLKYRGQVVCEKR
ncbi:MAG: hypothetical protein D6765_08870 [Bacteroidetes bacterium]|nr:MAG: hypothetical protein D6765_08870 [Bacteroidota bacterium]